MGRRMGDSLWGRSRFHPHEVFADRESRATTPYLNKKSEPVCMDLPFHYTKWRETGS